MTPRSERALEAVLKAQRVYIVGFGSSSWLGGLLQHSLDAYRGDAHLLATRDGGQACAEAAPPRKARSLKKAIP